MTESFTKKKSRIFHITHRENLQLIIRNGGLLAKNRMDQTKQRYKNIANLEIQDRRARVRPECGEGESLHDYVPFYFAPRSPMLYSIYRGNVQGYSEGQQPVIYLGARAKVIENARLPYIFTDRHAVKETAIFRNSLVDLGVIDWKLMNRRQWNNTIEDPGRMARRMAEFLVWNFVPWKLVEFICVFNKTQMRFVEDVLASIEHHPEILIKREWYYG